MATGERAGKPVDPDPVVPTVGANWQGSSSTMSMLEDFLFMRGEGSGKLDGGQTKTRGHESLPRFGPPKGKDLRPACLNLYWCGVIARCLQRSCRLDLAKGESSRDYEHSGGGEKGSES
jgi:hypothetical protein